VLLAASAIPGRAAPARASGVPSTGALAAPAIRKRLPAWVGLPAWLVGLWWFRPPPRPAHIEAL